jgi:hypothetical protein
VMTIVMPLPGVQKSEACEIQEIVFGAAQS